MKNILLSTILAMGFLVTTSLQAVTISGSAGVNTNNVDRGVSLSSEKPSASGTISVSSSVWGQNIYANETVSTITSGAKSTTEFGIKSSLGPVSIGMGYRYNAKFNSSVSHTGDEIFLSGNSNVFGGKLKSEFARGVNVNGSNDNFVKIGYERQVLSPQLSVGGALLATKYDGAGKLSFTAYELSALYTLTKSTSVQALVDFGGKNKSGAKLDTQASVGVNYKF